MKQGKSLQELAVEIERQKTSKRDFLADTPKLNLTLEGNLELAGVGSFNPTENCHAQISDRLKIPKRYYDRMREAAPELLQHNVNHWFGTNPEKRLVRTLDGSARAFLSDRYRVLDNFDLMEASLPIIQEQGCEIVSCEVTTNNLFIKALFPKIESEIAKGDIVQSGLVISNSETGQGSLRVEPLIYRLVCLNGMIANASMKKYHVGRGSGTNLEDIMELLSDKTRKMSDAAFWMQVQDIIRSVFSRDIFEANVNKLREAANQEIKRDPVQVIEIVKKDYNLTDNQGTSMLQHLIKGGDLSRWGLANAVTRQANDEESYEEATNLERLGGKIIELEPNQWKRIAEAS